MSTLVSSLFRKTATNYAQNAQPVLPCSTLVVALREFSRRSNVSSGSPYKVVKGRRPREAAANTNIAGKDPNFEFLASDSFPFFMHGNVGPAWYDKHTTIQNEGYFSMHELIGGPEKNSSSTSERLGNPGISCQAQACPRVLRQTVCDLFPYRNFEDTDLSVITISLKPNHKQLRKNLDIETEKLTQTFVLTAKNVCTKLRLAGYWADFINPFSGRPYFASTKSSELYETDEKFRCLDFQIFEIDKCLIVSNEPDRKRSFIGSLFTTAPALRNNLNDAFLTVE